MLHSSVTHASHVLRKNFRENKFLYLLQVTVTFYPGKLCSILVLCHVFIILTVSQAFSLLSCLSRWHVICDLWCHYYNFLFHNVYLMYIHFLRFNTITYFTMRLLYSVYITIIYTKKPKKLCDLLYWDSHFTKVVWNWTHNISAVCLKKHSKLTYLQKYIYSFLHSNNIGKHS